VKTLTLILSLVAALSGWYGYSAHVSLRAAHERIQGLETALQAQVKARASDSKALSIVRAQNTVIKTEKGREDVAVERAIEETPDWARAMVPSGVLDAAGL
jgi:hypothetical protein